MSDSYTPQLMNTRSLTAFGSEPFTPFNLLSYKTFQAQDSITKFTKNHSITLGGSFEKFHSDNSFYFGMQSAYSYNTLADFYADAERWDDLFALYDAMLERAADNDERLYLLEDAATVARDLAADAERTMRYLEALLEIQDDARTRTSLERLYERHNRHRPLIKLLGSDLPRLAADAAQRMRERIALLWIDGVGGYLVCERPGVVVGFGERR